MFRNYELCSIYNLQFAIHLVLWQGCKACKHGKIWIIPELLFQSITRVPIYSGPCSYKTLKHAIATVNQFWCDIYKESMASLWPFQATGKPPIWRRSGVINPLLPKWDLGNYDRPRSDAAECGVWLWSTLFAHRKLEQVFYETLCPQHVLAHNRLIIPYHATKFQAPSSNSFRDILLTS